MSSGKEDREDPSDKRLESSPAAHSSPEAEAHAEQDQELLGLLGEVIRMSQAWVRALESGDPFTADKHEAECVAAMERFEARRQRMRQSAASVEQTR